MKKKFFVINNYATAFLNSFIDGISKEEFVLIQIVYKFTKEHKKSFYFLEMPGLSIEKKQDALDKLFVSLKAPKSLRKLFYLLIRHKRSSLICDVLGQVCSLYKKKKNILFFNITSAHKLLEDELESIKIFLEQKTDKVVLYECKIDKKLIAGIRCYSETFVWELSIRNRLDNLRKNITVQGLR